MYNRHMPSGFIVECYDLQDAIMTKTASAKDECRDVMKAIYDENPSYWPYGLNMDEHQSVYLVRDKLTKEAAGFVGWQQWTEWPMKKVGSYSIGILPKYRGNGYASEAVAKILQEKCASVDEIRCYAVSSNKKSQGLAKKLHIKCFTDF